MALIGTEMYCDGKEADGTATAMNRIAQAQIGMKCSAVALRRDDEDGRGVDGQCLAAAMKGVELKCRGIEMQRAEMRRQSRNEKAEQRH